jgi:hypothetical protein
LRSQDDSSQLVRNRVVYSANGAESWQQIFEVSADVLGLAISPDGERIVLGVGDSRVRDVRPVDPSALGLYSASTRDHVFSRQRDGHVGCAKWLSDGLYFCALGLGGGDSGFELGLTHDEGVTSQRVMATAAIEAPLECPASASTNLRCPAEDWALACERVGRCSLESGELVPYPPSQVCALGSGGGAGTSAVDGGVPANGGTEGNLPGATVQSASEGNSGCCSVAARASGDRLGALALFGVWLVGGTVLRRAARSRGWTIAQSTLR